MWLLTTLTVALVATVCWYKFKGKYRLGFLSLMLWGATIMILVDHILGYEGGRFLELETEGLIGNGTMLGIWMLLPIVVIWTISLLQLKRL